MRYVVVGAGPAGLAAAEAASSLDPGAELVLLSEEDRLPYCRPLISYWLAGEVSEDLFPLPTGVLASVDLRRGVRATVLDVQEKALSLSTGETLTYDRLCLTTGARSKLLGLGGEGLPNVFGFRSRDDVDAIDDSLRHGAERAVVLGGGLVGVKAAHALVSRGITTILCIASGHPLSQTLDATGGRMIEEALSREGVSVRTRYRPVALETRGNRATAVRFEPPGETIRCDLVIRGKGVEPRTELPRGPVGGLPVDSQLRTASPDVWAAGDVACVHDVAWNRPRTNAIWPLAVEQGTLAGRNMAGAGECYPGGVAMNSLRVGELFVISAGVTTANGDDLRVLSRLEPDRGSYKKLVTRRGRVVGAIFASEASGRRGQTEQAGLLVSAIRRGASLAELPFDPLEARIHWGEYPLRERWPSATLWKG